MHSDKAPNVVHEQAFCATCKRVTAQDIHFSLDETKHRICCTCGSVIHPPQRSHHE